MNLLFRLCAALLFSLASIAATATHIVGGELYYAYLGNNQYEITLKVYRDCGPTNTNGTDFDPDASVGIYTAQGFHTEVLMSLFSAEVNFVPVVLENPCFILPPDVCVEEAVYTEVIFLPDNSTGYELVYQRCCRNPSIVNLSLPQDQGVTFSSFIPPLSGADAMENSSAVFNGFPPVALCANADFWFDHSATDPDGDSLVYELCQPLHGASPDFPAPAPPPGPPYTPVTYAAGFSAVDPITGAPGFEIDSETGFLTGTPTAVGQYVMGICVSEYRDGELICTNSRDFQFNVTLCDPNIVASISEQDDLCNGLTLTFENSSINASSFFWDFDDPDNPDATSDEASPTYTFTEAGVYDVTLIANPGWPCADTTVVAFEIFPDMMPEILDPTFECVEGTVLFDFTCAGNFEPGTEFFWDFPAFASPTVAFEQTVQNVTFSAQDDIGISLTTVFGACEESTTYDFIIPPPPEADIIPQETFCDGYSYTFENNSSNGDWYSWDFGAPGIADTSSLFQPEFTFPDTGLFVITLEVGAAYHCPVSDEVEYLIYTLLDPWYLPGDPQCFEGNAFDFAATGTSNPEAEFSWDFGANASPSGSNQQFVNGVTWNEPGWHAVTLAIEQDVCLKTFTDSIQIVPNPEIDFDILAGAGCPPFSVAFLNNSDVQTQAIWEWDFGDGNSAQDFSPVHVYTNTGSYDVSVTVTTTVGCLDSDALVLEDLVTVYPVPSASFDVEPNRVNLLNPEVQIADLSTGGVGCSYYFSDGGILEECDGSYTFSDGGYFDVIQYVVNEHGCVDEARAEVAVEGTAFYAPNAFTPDGDGINDVFLPTALGVLEYRFEIYNRWGERIWETIDRKEPWLGQVRDGNHYVQDGLYLWRVWYTDLLGFPRAFEGHVTVIR